MIIVSSGFPKSASTLLFLYTEEILKQSGKRSAQKTFRKKYREGFIHRFGFFNSSYLFCLNLFKGNVVVKTHAGPDFFLRVLLKLKVAKVYYSVRDPRDVLLSGLDHGKKSRAVGTETPADRAFQQYFKKEELYEPMKVHHTNYLGWKNYGDTLIIRYENLLASPETELIKILDKIDWKDEKGLLPGIIHQFDQNKSSTKNFNKGAISRFQAEYSPEEIEKIESVIGNIITDMGYALSSKK